MATDQNSNRSRDIAAKAFRYLPGGTLGNLSHPKDRAVVFTRGRGSKIFDTSGKEYVDYLLGSGPMILGHAHPNVNAAVQAAIDDGSTFFATNEKAVLLAEAIVNAVPCAEMVRFTTSGTDATFQCLRLARAYRKREKILKFEGGFHGMHDYSLMSLAPHGELPDFPMPQSNSAGIPSAVQDTVLVAPYNDLDTTTALIESFKDELAGVIIEPFQRLIAPVPGFLEGLREVTRQHDIPLIFDEIVTGFRFAYGGAQQYYGVIPDLAAFGKIVGGGFPLAVVAGNEEIMYAYDPIARGTSDYIPQIGTLNGNPVAAAAGLATLEELRKPGTYERLFATGNKLRLGLSKLLLDAELPAQVVGDDPMFDVLFTGEPIVDYRSTLNADNELMAQFINGLLERGILKGVDKFYISLSHDQTDIERTLEAIAGTIEGLMR